MQHCHCDHQQQKSNHLNRQLQMLIFHLSIEMEQDLKDIYIEVPQDVDGYLPMDYRPVWVGDILVGVEVFYYEQE